MINIGLEGDQFECLVNYGDTSNPNYFVYDTFDVAIDDITNAQAQICENPTPSPTDIATPAPTSERTPSPTDNPTKHLILWKNWLWFKFGYCWIKWMLFEWK